MEPFYKYALMISVAFLIICLIGIGILMQFQNAGTKFPLHPNVCPDRHVLDPTNSKLCKAKDPAQYGDLKLTDVPNICEKYKWAKKYNVNWDGVSNYNGCS